MSRRRRRRAPPRGEGRSLTATDSGRVEQARTTEVAPYDLLLDLGELGELLVEAARRGDAVDAFLLAAGMSQITDDYVHPDLWLLGTVAAHVRGDGGPLRTASAAGTEAALAAVQEARAARAKLRRVRAWQRRLARAVATLARAALDPGAPLDARLEPALAALVADARGLPAELRAQSLRLPSCFHAFDLDVGDVVELVRRFATEHGEPTQPVLVAGIRTSGSYMAPLVAAALARRGYAHVEVLTLRPRRVLLRRERQLVRAAARTGAVALVVDDPPRTGAAVRATAHALAAAGMPHESITLLLPMFGSTPSLPEELRRYGSVLLPADRWSIGRKLRPDRVEAVLARLRPEWPRPVPLEQPQVPAGEDGERHRRAFFELRGDGDDASESLRLLVEGAGIGWFGRHELAIADRLGELVAAVLGVDDGCLYRIWLPEEERACAAGSAPPPALETAIAAYVLARRRLLPAHRDRSLAERSERPVWEVAARTLAEAFGRGANMSRLLFADAVAMRLLRVDAPSVTDGATAPLNWFAAPGSPTGFAKVDVAKRSFWNLGLLSYDAAFDLAGAARASPDSGTASRLRDAYARLGGGTISDERWLLHTLAHDWGRVRREEVSEVEAHRTGAETVRRYLAHLFLADLEPAGDGAVCALDLDGVLETEALGFPAATRAGMLALRALIAHGYRPVIVSGRSAGEVADRCRDYRLAGGAAEYGAVVFAGGATEVQISDEDVELLRRVRAWCACQSGISIDDAYRFSVRAFVRDPRGRRGPLDEATVRAARTASGDPSRLRIVPGESQTDVAAAAVDKGSATRALLVALGDAPLALAVGDTATDVPMLREAERAFVPSHAPRSARTGSVVLPAPYQAGLAAAVGRLLGHPPGGCDVCRGPRLEPDAELLVRLLSVQERGRRHLVRETLELWWKIRSGAC